MVSRAIVASLLLVGTLVSATVATSGDRAFGRQWAIVQFDHPTWVASERLFGTYMIVHDEDRVRRGEACTALYHVGTRTPPLEEVVSFQCIPHERKMVPTFTVTVSAHAASGVDTLTEYQFAGDSEGHGVPTVALVSNQRDGLPSRACAR